MTTEEPQNEGIGHKGPGHGMLEPWKGYTSPMD